MNKTATMKLWTVAALLAGALTLPGLALAHDDDGYRDDWQRQHWRHHNHHHHNKQVVVIREPVYERVYEPVYVKPRPVVVAPVWEPFGGGITVVLGGHW